VNLPTGCFCTSGPTPTPYIPIIDLLEEIESKGLPMATNDGDDTSINCSSGTKGNVIVEIGLST